jgi:hypothetical protein
MGSILEKESGRVFRFFSFEFGAPQIRSVSATNERSLLFVRRKNPGGDIVRALRLLLLETLIGLIALPALAGTAYIPFVTTDPVGLDSGRSPAPGVDLYNTGSVPRRYSVRFVPAGTIGGVGGVGGVGGGSILQEGTVAPHAFASVSCCAEGSGVLIVTGAPQIAVSAGLSLMFNHPLPNSVGTRLPVITSLDAVPARGIALLDNLSWATNNGATSSLGILNFGSRLAHCSVSGFVEAAERFTDLQNLLVQAGSTIALPDVLGQRIGSLGFSSYAARPTVTCDQPFYPFAINYVGGTLPFIVTVPPALTLGNAP